LPLAPIRLLRLSPFLRSLFLLFHLWLLLLTLCRGWLLLLLLLLLFLLLLLLLLPLFNLLFLLLLLSLINLLFLFTLLSLFNLLFLLLLLLPLINLTWISRRRRFLSSPRGRCWSSAF